MAPSLARTLSLSLLILAATQECRGENKTSLYHMEPTVVYAMTQVSQVLQCIGDTTHKSLHTMQEGLRLQKQSSDALSSLPDMMQQVKEEFYNLNEHKNSVKRENEALNKVITLTLEITDLKTQLVTKDHKVQILHSTLDKYQRRVQELAQKLNNTQEAQKPRDWTKTCDHPQMEDIKQVVQEFISDSDWDTLSRGLAAVLDHSSVEYAQLKRIWSFYWVGYKGYIQLSSLLLCAGMPADTVDIYEDSILQGAADGGHMQLVKLLLEHGADVNMKGWNDNTPLLRAAHGGHLEMVKYLVQAGADTTARNKIDHNPLYWAEYYGDPMMKEYLKQLPN